MEKQTFDYGSQFRIAPSRTFIEYFDTETEKWIRYTAQDMGYVVWLEDWILVSSKGVFFKSKECPLVWDQYYVGDVFDEFESDVDTRDWRKEMYEDIYSPLEYASQTMEQIQRLPLITMFSDAYRNHDLPKFTFCLLAWLDFRVMESQLEAIKEKNAISKLSTPLNEHMSEMDRLSATCDMLGDIIALSEYVDETHFDMFSTDKYLAILENDFPFLKEILYSKYEKDFKGNIFSNCFYDNQVNLFNSNKEVMFPCKSIRKALGDKCRFKSEYNLKMYMQSPVFVKEAIYLPKLFRDYEQKHPEGWSLTSGNEEIDSLLAVAWENHDIIKLVWWFCIASQIKSRKRHFDKTDILAGKDGDINHMYHRLLEWDALEEEWFDPTDMPFWRSKCIHELTFLAEDALYFFGARS